MNERYADTEKIGCSLPGLSNECPDACPGLLASRLVMGCEVQICPNPERLGAANEEADCCGNGHDVLILHRVTEPSQKDYEKAVAEFGQ